MEEKDKTSEKKVNSNSKVIISVLISIILTAVIVGLISYVCFTKQDDNLQAEIDTVKAENRKLKDQVVSLMNKIEEMDSEEVDEMDDDDDSADDESEDETLPTDTFMYHEENNAYYGRLIATGYVTSEDVLEPFCETDCATYTYVTFNITSTDNIYLDDFLDLNTGNSFTGVSKIGIGCVEDGVLSRSNDSDEYGMVEYDNTLADSTSILNSDPDDTVTLQLERYLYTSGRGAPACYSHFAEVTILE